MVELDDESFVVQDADCTCRPYGIYLFLSFAMNNIKDILNNTMFEQGQGYAALFIQGQRLHR